MILQTFRSATSQSQGISQPRKLTLFFAGWGMDVRPFLSHLPPERDTVVCYDYSSLAVPDGSLSRLGETYDDILVVAWSLGVWAAARTLPAAGLRCRAAIAVNGTTTPVDDRTGIPADVFSGTLASLTPASLRKFHRRMFLSPADYAAFAAAPPERDFASVRDELRAVAEAAAAPMPASMPGMKWDRAVVSSHDRIFPPENLRRAWAGTRVLEVPAGHFPPAWRGIFDGTALDGTVPDGE